MQPVFAVVIGAVGLIATFTIVWAVQLRTRNAGIVDPVWAASLGGLSLLAAALGQGAIVNRVFVAVGGTIWSVRLASHLLKRQAGQPEDSRYRALREEWGDACASRMFWFFQLQAAVCLALSVAFFVPAYCMQTPSWFALAVAFLIWVIAVGGEALADRQLKAFLSDPLRRGEVCRVGLWRYSRHPNYFFECVHWLAYTPLALGTGWVWATLAAPALMALLLIKISGIPLLEARLANTRDGYREYMRTTSALVPWPPKKRSEDRTEYGQP